MLGKCQLFYRCVFGPTLYQTYPAAGRQLTLQAEHLYRKNSAERLADHVFLMFRVFLDTVRIIWPFCLIYFYVRGSLTLENGFSLLRLVPFMAIVFSYCRLLRGIGRLLNPEYQAFVNEFYQVKNNSIQEVRQKFLSRYDFSLCHWPADYTTASSAIRKLPTVVTSKDQFIQNTWSDQILHHPFLLLGYICVNVFGRRFMFPGSLQIFQHMMERSLLNGRTLLVVSHRAKRAILRTADANHIDTVFVDRRQSRQSGDTLVITCEGNAGFYEAGCMMTPVSAGYSVLGWNRPGFSESSGYPGVLSEINAIDAVMRYAIERLGFPTERIVVFAWSIGGYAACWTGVHYPEIRGLVLDAVFDDVLSLAQRRMPSFLSNFVERTIRSFLDLNNIRLLRLYQGPFYLIRRTNDEIISLIPGQLESNRGNEIIFDVLSTRYPCIYHNEPMLTLLREYICADAKKKLSLEETSHFDEDELHSQMASYRREHPIASYPCRFGEDFSVKDRQRFAIHLVNQYLVDFDATHCTSLPQRYFSTPSRCV